jgi:glutamate--cysteine ligase
VASGRWQELALCRANGERVPVGNAARELLDRLQPLAEQLDGWEQGETYRNALAAQRDKLQGSDWAVPSARVLDAMSASGLGHRDWTLEMSRQHQQTLRNETLAPDVLSAYQAMTRESLAEQQAMEAADTQPFSEFLADYLKA